MAKPALKIGEISKPRFEFRTFGHNFNEQAKLMARLSAPVPKNVGERTSEEIYILSKSNDINNTKIRDGKMDIKTYVQTVDGLEQWNPLMKEDFPIAKKVLLNDVFPVFQVEIPPLTQDSYTLEAFLTMIDAHTDLQAVKVSKQRFGYMVNDTICEVGNVWINGIKVVTINVESTALDDIKALAGIKSRNLKIKK